MSLSGWGHISSPLFAFPPPLAWGPTHRTSPTSTCSSPDTRADLTREQKGLPEPKCDASPQQATPHRQKQLWGAEGKLCSDP